MEDPPLNGKIQMHEVYMAFMARSNITNWLWDYNDAEFYESENNKRWLFLGGQVVSWKNERREELLFRTLFSNYCPDYGFLHCLVDPVEAPKAFRGGIPISFPQFGTFGSLERHGFARNRVWLLDDSPSPLPAANSQSTVDLILKSTEEDLKIWPHRWENT
ncbi:hypothetical protein KY289_014217 [Solanum tuberosum]|nr:hypothetical protein KY289_014217 [Solanum tuberosum]